MDDLRKQTTGVIVFSFDSPPSATDFAALPGVTTTAVHGNELSVTVDGPVAPVLARAGGLGAVTVRTERRDLDAVFLDLYAHERGTVSEVA